MVTAWVVPLSNMENPLDITCIMCQTKEIAHIQTSNIMMNRSYFPMSEPIRLNVCRTKFNILMNSEEGFIWDNNLVRGE